jgi:hypothetical protein
MWSTLDACLQLEDGRHGQLLAKGGIDARILELQRDEVDALLDTDGAQPAQERVST